MKRLLVICLLLAGCSPGGPTPNLIWGRKGVRDGDVARPRAAVIDNEDRLWVVDFTARVQAFSLEGKHLGITFTTPDYRKGRPSGLSLGREGHLVVSDSHYHCFRVYNREGEELRRVSLPPGGSAGQLGYVSDVVQDQDGYWYVAEFGEAQRITKLTPEGKFLKCWGREGLEPGQFSRIRALALGPDGLLYAADACNHRVQVFTLDGELVRHFGGSGNEPGQMLYPYDLAFGPDGSLYVAEFGNHRVQKLTQEGEPQGMVGSPGRGPGQLHGPWALAVDRWGRVHVIDTENHRVQRFTF